MDPSCAYYCYRKNRDEINSNTNKAEKIKLVFFDMDGVLADTISSWNYLHDHFGTSNERSFDDYLRGKIDDLEFIKRDVALWKENGKLVKKDTIRDVLFDIPVTKGAEECVAFLRENNIKTAIVSAGLDILAKKVAKDLGIDYAFANGVKTDKNGRLTGDGILEVELMYKEKKVKDLTKKLNIPLEHCAAVGNSCFDIPMFDMCGLGIAFNPADKCVRESADVIVEGKDLSDLIPVFEKFLN